MTTIRLHRSTYRRVHELANTLCDPAFQPQFNAAIVVYPHNIVRLALENFWKECGGVPPDHTLAEQTIEDAVKKYFPERLGVGLRRHEGFPVKEMRSKLKGTLAYQLMTTGAAYLNIREPVALSGLVENTVDHLVEDCDISDWERFQLNNNGSFGSGNRAGGHKKGVFGALEGKK